MCKLRIMRYVDDDRLCAMRGLTSVGEEANECAGVACRHVKRPVTATEVGEFVLASGRYVART